jgi:hypothetical protein
MPRPKLNPDTIKKCCETCKNEFDVKFYKRNIQRFCSKKCSVNNPEIKEKNRQGVKKTFMDKYGTHPMKTEQGIANLKKSVLEKHGVDWISKKAGWFDVVKKNNLKKYGVETYNNIEQIKKTMLNRSSERNNEINEKTKITKFKNHYEYLKDLFTKNKIEMLCNFDEYKGYHFNFDYQFKCLVCDRQFEDNVYKPNDVFCKYCNPERVATVESNFLKFLLEILPKDTIVKQRDRTILVGKELDFYIPSKNVAFELNGLYWHSENGKGLKKSYHLNKTKACACHGIRLIHIFENELKDKENIVKSVVKNVLGITTDTVRIYARECEIREVDIKEKNEFLNRTHLQGEDKSTIKLGLYKDDKLVSLMTFRKTSRFDKDSDWELMRFSNELNTLVVGGASKLFSHFINNYKYKQIVSYSDRRYFNGEIYNKLGFKFTGFTAPNYYYIVNKYKDLRHRMSFQKHKLPKLLKEYRDDLSEWENMKLNGYDRIWDCGNSKFLFINPN